MFEGRIFGWKCLKIAIKLHATLRVTRNRLKCICYISSDVIKLFKSFVRHSHKADFESELYLYQQKL